MLRDAPGMLLGCSGTLGCSGKLQDDQGMLWDTLGCYGMPKDAVGCFGKLRDAAECPMLQDTRDTAWDARML